MNPQLIGKAMNAPEEAEYCQSLPQQVANSTLKPGAQSLGASPTLGPHHGAKALKKQNQTHGPKLAGRSAKKTAPIDPTHQQ